LYALYTNLDNIHYGSREKEWLGEFSVLRKNWQFLTFSIYESILKFSAKLKYCKK